MAVEFRRYRMKCRWCDHEFGVVHNSNEERAFARLARLHSSLEHADEMAALKGAW